jgi:hypothetical protein
MVPQIGDNAALEFIVRSLTPALRPKLIPTPAPISESQVTIAHQLVSDELIRSLSVRRRFWSSAGTAIFRRGIAAPVAERLVSYRLRLGNRENFKVLADRDTVHELLHGLGLGTADPAEFCGVVVGNVGSDLFRDSSPAFGVNPRK